VGSCWKACLVPRACCWLGACVFLA
jgi:hypothetical protein